MNQDPGRYVCLNCSFAMEGQKCKIRCTRCGYFESCSDLEPAPPYSDADETSARPQALSDADQTSARPQALSDADQTSARPQALKSR